MQTAVIFMEVFPKVFASSDGRVYSAITHRFLKPGTNLGGRYLVSILDWNGRRRTREVAPLICEAFHGPRPPGTEVSHINGVVTDNRAENLRWETHKQNLARKKQHGTHDSGFDNSRAVLTPHTKQELIRLRQQGQTMHQIANTLGVSRTTVSRVLNGERYQ